MDKTPYNMFVYAILLITFQMPCLAQKSTSLVIDQYALLALKAHITLDPYLILTRNWTNSSFVCSWIGVTCGLRHHRVTALNISNMNLLGTIPPQLGNLSFLVSLDLTHNIFSGTLPQELSFLRRLKFISLKVNNFGGEIPSWFGILPKLEYLSLRNNSFTGFVPKSLSNLSNIQFLDFSFNSLQGKIPEQLGRLHSLQVLSMQFNHLSSPVPLAIFNMSTLKIIAFTSNELSGNLPIDICCNLPFLQGFYMSFNQLSGQLPSNLSKCSQLEKLSLSYNSFSGRIPTEIGKLKSLKALSLGGNYLNGVLPHEIGNLQNLIGLGIEQNQITGTIPLSIRNLTMLKYLYLMDNKFTGVIPREIGQLYELEVVGLDSNTFTGSLPTKLFNISTLRVLGLTTNSLLGSLPNHLCYGLPLIEVFYLGGNYFSGAIPNSISNCSNLRILDLAHNKFVGFVPHFLGNLRLLEQLNLNENNLRIESYSELSFITSLTNCRSLKSLQIGDNPLDGIIPASVGNLSSSLQEFVASDCRIKGSIPAEIGNLSNLVRLSLYGNEFSGDIPLTVKHLQNLQGLYLDNSNLEGSVPKVLCDLHSLNSLNLSQNQFSGPIPECLGNVTSLRYLLLRSNMLTSTIPSSLWGLKDLLVLDLSSNSLTGFLPQEIGNLMAAIAVDLAMNQLSESIPDTIGNLKNLVRLFLAHNRLEGSIPVSVGSMISLVTLDLSYNNFSGSIPKSLEALLYLDDFNVSFNALSGEIPTGGPFRHFTVESFVSNVALCGIPRFNVPLCHAVFDHRSRQKKVQLSLFILIGVVSLITVVSLAFISLRYRKKDKKTSGIDVSVSPVPERISYYEILQATQHFSESNLLDIGSRGSVYRGILQNGKAVAVKVFNLQSEAAFRSFDVECEVLRNIRHRNLAKVISSCSNEDFKALVLEYMPNGNLEKWLYSHNYCLDVMQRLHIMIDVASALEYLHHGYSTPIVHCDLKPSNVLLDEEMIAHVSDFGIAKLLGDGESIVLTNTIATLGYIAPEYGLEGLVSTRCDVYSYGVMLMETFTRKRPSDDMFVGDLSLKNWVESSLPQSSHQVIDANLLMNIEEKHFDKILQCVSSILVLALKCSAESPGDRINIKEALAELHKIKRQFSR